MTLREKLAKLEHDQWSHWFSYMRSVLEIAINAGMSIPRTDQRLLDEGHPRGRPMSEKFALVETSLERWERQARTRYDDLTEKEKDSDREWADKVMDEIQRAGWVPPELWSYCPYCGVDIPHPGGHVRGCPAERL